MPRPYPVRQAEGEVLWEVPQLAELPPHLRHEKLRLGPQILLYAVAEELRKPPGHGPSVPIREADLFQEVEPGEELLLDAAGEQRGMPRDGRDAEHLEEVEGGAETAGHVGDEEAGAATDDASEIAALDAGLAEEEGDGGGEVGGGGGEDLGAHAAGAADLGGGEAEGAEEVDGDAEVGEGSGNEGRVGGGCGEEVDAKGVEEEELVAEGGGGRGGGIGRQKGKSGG